MRLAYKLASVQNHDTVMEKIDTDKEIEELYNEITKVIDVRRVVRGEFEKV
jgi:hypothetical protein